ncbi:DUF6221 family protein [Promicromonospora sp. NFX87]|uniref:DUF6221 family protein n=1 Tax=Promicromonospora sp. NFX87 TaxID=3402691 RepID=UPI003AFA7769
MSPTEFLTARHDEETDALVKLLTPGWTHDGTPSPTPDEPLARVHKWTLTLGRVLADVTAKQAIVEQHRPATAEDTHEIGAHPINDGRCSSCVALHDERGYCEQMEYPCPTTLALLQPHAEHPDFDPTWATT